LPATTRRFVALGVSILTGILLLGPPAEADDQGPVQGAVDHLLSSQLPSGLLAYDFDFLLGTPTGQDHLVRQTGVIAFLAEYYVLTKDERVRPALHRALKTFGALSAPVGKRWVQSGLEALGLLSVPVGRHTTRVSLERLGLLYTPKGKARLVTLDRDYGKAFAGATAMALLAELRYARVTGSDEFRDLRTAWKDGLMTLRIPRGGFRTSPTSIDDSPFFDGEAWLALAHYASGHPTDQDIGKVLAELEGHLMQRYAERVTSGFYQWGTMAAAARLQATGEARFADFVRRQAEKFLDSRWLHDAKASNTCAAVEGLEVAAAVLRRRGDSPALVGRLEARTRDEMEKNRTLQIPSGTDRWPLGPATNYLVSPHFARFAGAFLEGLSKPYTRIDITGHCLSAMVKKLPSAQ
jgi:hypothetical protein